MFIKSNQQAGRGEAIWRHKLVDNHSAVR